MKFKNVSNDMFMVHGRPPIAAIHPEPHVAYLVQRLGGFSQFWRNTFDNITMRHGCIDAADLTRPVEGTSRDGHKAKFLAVLFKRRAHGTVSKKA
jgi:hypothetical protein